MQKTCDRCRNIFDCNSSSIEDCHCSTIKIHPDISSYLKKTSYDCLCENCLQELNNYPEMELKYPFPDHPTKYVENIHYYLDGQYWVFTNYYHYLKGNCCKNNCRHCAYGYNN